MDATEIKNEMVEITDVINKCFNNPRLEYSENWRDSGEAVIFNPEPFTCIVIVQIYHQMSYLWITKYKIQTYDNTLSTKQIYSGGFPPNENKDGIDKDFLSKILENYDKF